MDCAVIIEELLRDARNVGLILMVIVLNVEKILNQEIYYFDIKLKIYN